MVILLLIAAAGPGGASAQNAAIPAAPQNLHIVFGPTPTPTTGINQRFVDRVYDFGTASSPVATGAIGVALAHYSAEQGYGWVTPAGLATRDRFGTDPLTRDFVAGADGTFVIDLPNGEYTVTVYLGDKEFAHDAVAVWAEGVRVLSGLSTTEGTFLSRSVSTIVSDGQLTLRLADEGGNDPNFAVNALRIESRSPNSNLSLPPLGTIAGIEGEPVALTSTASGGQPPYLYLWDIDGNGAYDASGAPAAAKFNDNGNFSVTLKVVDRNGAWTTQSGRATIANAAPTANAGSKYTTVAGYSLTLFGSGADASPVDMAAGLTYRWDFGDGTVLSGVGLTNPAHPYRTTGAFTVQLSVSDKDGGTSATSTAAITVARPQPESLAAIGFSAGEATFGEVFAEGQVRAAGFKIGTSPAQADIKTKWPDGSVRYAVVSTLIPEPGIYELLPAATTPGTVSPAPCNARVDFATGNGIYSASLPAAHSADIWLNGAIVIESRHVVTPVTTSGVAHPYLRVVFDRRSYTTGTTALDVAVENVLDVAGATMVPYDVRITVDNQERFRRDGVKHYWMTRYVAHLTTGATAASVIPDLHNFYAANALPLYNANIPNTVERPEGATFDILLRGGLAYDDMTSPGGRAEIAPYPDWAARYLVHKDPTQLSYLLVNADLSGSQPIHIKGANGTRITIDDIPDYWLDPRAHPWQPGPMGDWSARGPLIPDGAHQPSLAYVPYLLTGSRYYADEVRYWADFNLLSAYSSTAYATRDGSVGLLRAEQTRGFAWKLRNIVDAAAYLPDGDSAKGYFAAKIRNNLNWLDSVADTQPAPLGVAWLTTRDNHDRDPAGAYLWVAPWEHRYLAWAIDHAHLQGFQGGARWLDQMAGFTVRLFTSADYPRDRAASYVFAIAQLGSPNRYFTTFSEMVEKSYPPGVAADPFPYAQGGFGIDIRQVLMIAAARGQAGAAGALDYVEGLASTDPSSHPGWAIERWRN